MTDIVRAALVTGASSGIGAAIARRLAAPGVGLALHARRNRAGAERAKAAVEAKGAKAIVVEGDLATAGLGAALVDRTASAFGRFDVLVSNAGYADKRPVGEVDAAGWRAAVDGIQSAFFELIGAARPHLEKSKEGRVVAVTAFGAHVVARGLPTFPATAAAKAGVEALARAFAMQVAPFGVTVNCVSPGFVEKEAGTHSALSADVAARMSALVPLRRYATPDDVAAVVAFLCSSDARYVTGQTWHVDGGLSL